MALLLAHDPKQALAVVIARRGVDQLALLLGGPEFGVALKENQMEQRVAHVLGGHVENFFEFLASFEFAEFDGWARAFIVNRVELVVFDQAGRSRYPSAICKKDLSNHRNWRCVLPMIPP